MYASPVQRGCTSILEDFPTLYNIKVEAIVPEAIKKIRLMPQNTEIAFCAENGVCTLMVPEVTGHQMIVMEY